MNIDVKKVPQATEEEWQWMERMADLDDDFPGESGLMVYRMRVRCERAEREYLFEQARKKFHNTARPRAAERAKAA